MMMDGLAPIRDELRSSLKKADPQGRVVAAYLFGSHASHEAGVDSDLDVAFLLDEKAYRIDPFETGAPAYLAATHVGVSLDKEVDITILNAASLEMAYEIVTTGICLLEDDPDKRMSYEIAVRGMYFDFRPFLDELRSNCLANL